MTQSKVKTQAAGKTNTAMARVPITGDWLSQLYKPKKTTYAQLELVDIPGLSPGSEKAAAVFLMRCAELMRCCTWYGFLQMTMSLITARISIR